MRKQEQVPLEALPLAESVCVSQAQYYCPISWLFEYQEEA
jgi:hypothetical protein